MPLLPVLLTGWYFGRNVRDFGKPFVSSFDLPQQAWVVAPTDALPYLERRPLGFVFGLDPSVLETPYWPVGLQPHARFWPVLVTSTFVDYWNHFYSGLPATEATVLAFNARPMTPEVLEASQRSAKGGAVIALAVALAWLSALRWVVRERQWGFLALLTLAAIGVLFSLHFAVSYPRDDFGVIKSTYVQYAAAPLYALFGLAAAWTIERARRWPLALALGGSLWAVAAYSLYCRLRIPLLPL